MKKYPLFLLLMTVLAGTFSHADVTMHKRKTIPAIPIHPIKPPVNPVRPVLPGYINTAYIDNSVNTYESCDKYKDMIDELNDYIDHLEKQVAELQEKEHARLREKLKKKNDVELKKFENRRSSVKTNNKIEIRSQ